MPNIKLRQDIIRSLPYVGNGRSQCIYWDDTLPAFGLRVFKMDRSLCTSLLSV
jgi:hypothetical protein